MNASEVLKIAEKFIAKEDLNGWNYELQKPYPDSKCKGEWNVLVHWSSLDGGVLDGPGIIIVCEKDKTARFFEQLD